MRQHGGYETEWAPAHPVQRRADGSAGVGGMSDVLLGLQRSAGNAAVAGHLAAAHHLPTSGGPMAFVQRCGPTPCNCSAEERADYADKHPDEPATAEADTAGAGAGAGHDIG